MKERLEAMLERAYTLSAQVLNGDTPDMALAEEVSGECAELLAHINGDTGAFESDDVIDSELSTIAQALPMLDTATTLIYNTEGDAYQKAYEQLEEIINQLKGERK